MNYIKFYTDKCMRGVPEHLIDSFDFCTMSKVDSTELAAKLTKPLTEASKAMAAGEISAPFTGKWWKLPLEDYAKQLVPTAEDMFSTHMFVDKVYIYRTVHAKKEVSSWIWHYDNNPETVLKIFIYLTDVDDDCAPFRFEKRNIMVPTRQGTENWRLAPNNSRIPDNDIDKSMVMDVTGAAGTTFMFYPNVAHKATIPAEGKYRDVCVLRIRPWHSKSETYINRSWTSSWEKSGAVPKDPETR